MSSDLQELAGLALNAILLLILVEAALLIWLWHIRGQGVAPSHLLPNLAAGFLLMLAIRLALSDQWLPMLGVLGASFIAHLADLRMRWNSADSGRDSERPK